MARRISAVLRPPAVARALVPAAGPGPQHHGSFCAVQLADGSTGIAYTLLEDGLAQVQAARDDARLIGSDPARLAQRFASPRMA